MEPPSPFVQQQHLNVEKDDTRRKLGRTEEERVVPKSKPMWNLVSKIVDQSPTALGSSASNSPGKVKAHSSNSESAGTGRSVARGLNDNTASSSQMWHFDANTITNTRKPCGTNDKENHWYKVISPQL